MLTSAKLRHKSKESIRRHRIPQPIYARKETAVIYILIASRNGDRKTVQPIRMSGPPMRIRK